VKRPKLPEQKQKGLFSGIIEITQRWMTVIRQGGDYVERWKTNCVK
jgi:hypothetical protein